MASSRTLQVIVKAKDEASKKLASAGKKMAASLEGVSRKAKMATAALGLIGGISIKAAAEFDSLKESFDRTTTSMGINGDELISKMKEVSAGTISNSDLIASANRAMALGVGDDVGQMTDLLEIARVKGRQMGLDTTQAFNDIVTGLGRGSPMILDNLGITIKLSEAQSIYAESLGKSVDQLSETEKKQALLNAVLQQGREELAEVGALTITNKEKMEKLSASLGNAKVVIGQQLLPALIPLIEKFTETITKVSAWIAENPKLFLTLTVVTTAIIALTAILPILITLVTAVGTVFLFIAANPIVLIIAALVALGVAIVLLIKNWETVKEKTKQVWENIKAGIAVQIQAIKAIFVAFFAASGAVFDAGFAAISDTWSAFWDGMKAVAGAAVAFITGIIDGIVGAITAVVDKLKALKNAAGKGLSAAGGAIKSAGAAVGGAFHRQSGGNLFAGQTAIVGENGPEAVSFGQTGRITPTNRLGGGGSTIQVNVTGNTLLGDAPEMATKIGDMIFNELRLNQRIS